MREVDIFILPSKNETFGMVYLEAMASGCITVCSKGDGVDGIIKDSINGFLCDDVEQVFERIMKFEDKNWILENSYNTIRNYTDLIVANHYLKNIGVYYEN